MQFQGIQWMPILDLRLSQLYLSEDKLRQVRSWLSPETVMLCHPLPVHDFGNGRYTLTDGHSRAFVAYMLGITKLPVVYDEDEIVACEPGCSLYREDIRWCDRFGLQTIADLAGRILSSKDYQRRWQQRCDRSFDLITQTTASEREKLGRNQQNLFLYGANSDLSVLYFEDCKGDLWEFSNGIFRLEGF